MVLDNLIESTSGPEVGKCKDDKLEVTVDVKSYRS